MFFFNEKGGLKDDCEPLPCHQTLAIEAYTPNPSLYSPQRTRVSSTRTRRRASTLPRPRTCCRSVPQPGRRRGPHEEHSRHGDAHHWHGRHHVRSLLHLSRQRGRAGHRTARDGLRQRGSAQARHLGQRDGLHERAAPRPVPGAPARLPRPQEARRVALGQLLDALHPARDGDAPQVQLLPPPHLPPQHRKAFNPWTRL